MEFDWIDGALTIEMVPITHRVGIVRYHSDPAKIPGDVEWTCAAIIDQEGNCKFKIMSRDDALDPVKFQNEARRLIRYFESLGCKVSWGRRKNDKEHKEVTAK